MSAPTKADIVAAAGVLREVLGKAERGELEAEGRRGKAVVARIEGALLGLDAATGAHDPARSSQTRAGA